MIKYIIKRILLVIPVILGVLCIVFILQAVTPGDAVDQLLPADATEEQKEAKRDELGLNDPIIVQFGRYVYNFFTSGDLGTNYKTNQPVSGEIATRFPSHHYSRYWFGHHRCGVWHTPGRIGGHPPIQLGRFDRAGGVHDIRFHAPAFGWP